jgi:translocation and assembly module TamB
LAFGNGSLRATLGGDRLQITRFSLEGAGGAATGGTLELTGSALWPVTTGSAKAPPPTLTLQATAQRLRVSARADRRLTLSGQATAHLTQGLLTLRGALKADQAQFTLPDETAPALGSDVVVRLNRAVPIATSSSVAMKTDVSVQVDLGPRFELQGQGLQTRLTGELTVSSPPKSNSFQVLGEVRAVNGTYRAYGQPLRIEDGVLRFSGPYDDPSLDVLALRGKANPTASTTGDQQVGVRITGSARTPRVALYANPDLPDSEKLAWLVLGRPATGVGAEAAVLQQAALALLTDKNGRGMDASLASALGLDDIYLRGGTTLNSDGTTTQTTAISLGKRLSSKVYVAYEQSLNSAVGAVNLFYEVSRRLTVRAQAGQESALDLIFTIQHD